jgi:hypothetical protein
MLSLTMEMGLGLMQEVGHVDFYPNGGENNLNVQQTHSK